LRADFYMGGICAAVGLRKEGMNPKNGAIKNNRNNSHG